MARLASDMKMGYYPTPEGALREICSFLGISERVGSGFSGGDEDGDRKIYVLDPCCGEGEAIRFLANYLWSRHYIKLFTYGIEADGERFVRASEILDKVLHGSIFDSRVNPLESFGLLWLNPPYSSEGGERVEMKFLKHSIKWLCDGGVLIFIVPESVLGRDKDRVWISMNFSKIRVYRFPGEEYQRFKQVVLIGLKGRGDGEISPPPYPYISERVGFASGIEDRDEFELKYVIPYTEGPKIFQSGKGVTAEEIENFRPFILREIRRIVGSKNSFRMRPLLPLRKGHLVALLTAGMLDGKVETSDGGFILVKGFSDRVTTTWTDEESRKEITRNTYSVGVRVMEDGGRWYDIR